jgi:hypothetical protein
MACGYFAHDAVEAALGSAEREPIADAADIEQISPAVEKSEPDPTEPPMTKPALTTVREMLPPSACAGVSIAVPKNASNAIRLERNTDVARIFALPRALWRREHNGVSQAPEPRRSHRRFVDLTT